MTSAGGRDGSLAARGVAARLAEPVLLDRVVADLRELQRQGGLERTLSIGELILNQFFGGDSAAWRDRRRNKNNSIRRLANRRDCPFSKSALNEAVAVYVASLALPCVRTFGHIGAAHVAAVLKLPVTQREQMLSRAESDCLSVRELRREVVVLRRAEGERRGRPVKAELDHIAFLLRTGMARIEEGIGKIHSAALDARSSARFIELARSLGRASSELTACVERGPTVTKAQATSEELICLEA